MKSKIHLSYQHKVLIQHIVLSVFSILTLLSLFLPFIVSNLGVSGYELLMMFMAFFSHGSNGLISLIIIIFLGLGILGGFLTSQLLLKIRRRLIYILNLVFSSIILIGELIVLFNLRSIISSNLTNLNTFYVDQLSIGYYLVLILSFLSMLQSLKLLKIDRGYIALIVLSIVWLFPIVFIVLTSLRTDSGQYTSEFFPSVITFNNYVRLFTEELSLFNYPRWFLNTIVVSLSTTVLSAFLILCTAFVFSRTRFKSRLRLMKLFIILGMFPGFMSMIAVYFIIKALGLSESLLALIITYSSGAALGYYIVKGFLDTIPTALDEAAMIEGATKFQIFTKIIIPLSKPIIIYILLTSFIGPWGDYIFSSVILGANREQYTVALGLYQMLSQSTINTWYTRFAAGAVLIAVPIAFLFISLKKYYVEGLSGSVKG